MNQILVTKKLYITPEMKRKKKIYKFDFMISIFLMLILVSLYIYAEFDRNKAEEVLQDILANINVEDKSKDNTIIKNNVLIAVLDEDNNEQELNSEEPQFQQTETGDIYTTVGKIEIPKLNLSYPILEGKTGSETETEALLKISPCKFWGPDMNEIGNYCIVGHNYRNSKFFSKVPTLENGDIIELTDLSGRKLKYKIYNKYVVDPTDVSCTSQKTDGKKEVTLITCTDDSKQRVVIKAKR